jgi:hypothetical protein
MALLDAVGSILQTGSVGTLATNLFLSQMPDSPDECVVVLETQGAEPNMTFGASVASVERPRIRVVARASQNDYVSAKTKIEAARTVLGAVRNQTLESTKIVCILDTTGSYPLSWDGEDRPLIGCDFAVWVER